MDLDLTGKLALVTGSTRGIGFATAAGLAGMGAEVIVNGRDKAALDEAIAKIRQATPKAKLHAAAFDLQQHGIDAVHAGAGHQPYIESHGTRSDQRAAIAGGTARSSSSSSGSLSR